jgi:hypothetical protein
MTTIPRIRRRAGRLEVTIEVRVEDVLCNGEAENADVTEYEFNGKHYGPGATGTTELLSDVGDFAMREATMDYLS